LISWRTEACELSVNATIGRPPVPKMGTARRFVDDVDANRRICEGLARDGLTLGVAVHLRKLHLMHEPLARFEEAVRGLALAGGRRVCVGARARGGWRARPWTEFSNPTSS